MEIYNKKNYRQFAIISSILLFLGLGILFILKQDGIFIFVLLFIIIEIYLLSKKFTYKIVVTDNIVQITYYRWAAKQKLNLDISKTRASTGYFIANRGYKYKLLNIYFNNELVYTFNSNDGFSNEDIDAIEVFISKKSKD